MKYSFINKTDINAGKIVLGTDAFGSTMSEKDSFDMMDAFLFYGGNVLDTASAYADWRSPVKSISEKTIGKWISERGCRDKVIIATKGGHPDCKCMDVLRLMHDDIVDDFNNSLRNLRTDRIDIYWLHRDDESLSVDYIMDTLHDIYLTGGVRCFGVSNWKYERIVAANRYNAKKGYAPIVASQIQYSVASANKCALMPGIIAMDDSEYKKYCADDLAMFAFSSQARGFFSLVNTLGADNISESLKAEYINERNIAVSEKIKTLASEHEVDVSVIVTSSLICDKNLNTFAQIGTNKLSRLEDTMKTCDFILTQQEIDWLKS